MSSINTMHVPCAIALLFGALLVSSCSGSGTADPDSNVIADDGSSVIQTDESSSGSETESLTYVPDPLVQNSTRVTFDITVPAYQSDALQLRVFWGGVELEANWVGDEYWTAFYDFPTNTEQVLLVTFSDDNGAIALGSYEKEFKTGTNSSELYEITADQFDTNRWDHDGDGVNNLAESIAGTDPLVDEAALIEVRDSYTVQSVNLVSGHYEHRIPAQRPYFEHSEELPTTDFYTDRKTHIITIDIDAFGTGSISDKYKFEGPANSDVTTRNQVATRTRSGNSIIWAGTYLRYNTGAGVGDEMNFTIETEVINESTRTQKGTIKREESGVSAGIIQDLTYSLTGMVGPDSNNCEPTSGSLSNDVAFNHALHLPHTVTTVNKGVNEEYWTVSVASPEGQIQETYFVRSLNARFRCKFGDL